MEFKYDPESPIHRELQHFSHMAFHESERGLILIVTADLDEKLKNILNSYLEPSRVSDDNIFKHHGALGNFSNRIEMVYRLGIIDASFANAIDSLRKSRNLMAHELDHTLDKSPHIDHINNSLVQIEKSNHLKNIVDASYKLHAQKEETINPSSVTHMRLKDQFKGGRIKLKAIHLILSVILDFIYQLIDRGVEKNQIYFGLESFEEDMSNYCLLMSE